MVATITHRRATFCLTPITDAHPPFGHPLPIVENNGEKGQGSNECALDPCPFSPCVFAWGEGGRSPDELSRAASSPGGMRRFAVRNFYCAPQLVSG